ncbi:hypothetical protein E1B28_006619 [Marasmius oreades]|uniref:Protein kinase domain-containing protein n=1 Tax=Marasmius oreades TaxID=181124 RepID=A0A9P7UWH6_9AGAR|nr:uncharacterized protein E1B28_006619 [Marasmius oreades]KAG7095935.1 hypothetical protein E1B28_006619 [Marasmius oreades]
MEAHTWLVHELRILHRDISPCNILMEREADEYHVRRGYLIDFDHALDLARVDPSQSPGRSFFAAALLLDPNDEDNEVFQSEKDDTESLFYSIVYLGLLQAQHSLSDDHVALEAKLNFNFESTLFEAKAGSLLYRAYSKIRWVNRGLQKFVEVLEPVFRSRYLETDIRRPMDQANIVNLDTRSWMDMTIRDIVQTMPPPPEMEFITNEHYRQAAASTRKRAYKTQNTENRLGLDGHLDKRQKKDN